MSDDTAYYYHRAEAELERAQLATSPAAVRAHYTLAGHYLDRVYGGRDQEGRSEIAAGKSRLSR